MISSLTGIKPGDLYTKTGTDVWRVTQFCEEPTIILTNVETGVEQGGAVGSPIVGDFEPLRRSFVSHNHVRTALVTWIRLMAGRHMDEDVRREWLLQAENPSREAMADMDQALATAFGLRENK